LQNECAQGVISDIAERKIYSSGMLIWANNRFVCPSCFCASLLLLFVIQPSIACLVLQCS